MQRSNSLIAALVEAALSANATDDQLREVLPEVLARHGFDDEASVQVLCRVMRMRRANKPRVSRLQAEYDSVWQAAVSGEQF